MASSCRAAVTPATEHLGGYQDTLVFAAVGEAFQPALHWTSMLRKEGEANFRMERPQKAERHPRLQPCRYEYYQCTTTTTVIKVTSVIKVIMVTSVNSVIRIIRVSMVIRMIMVRTILRCGATSYEGASQCKSAFQTLGWRESLVGVHGREKTYLFENDNAKNHISNCIIQFSQIA